MKNIEKATNNMKWYIPFCAILRGVQSLNYRN